MRFKSQIHCFSLKLFLSMLRLIVLNVKFFAGYFNKEWLQARYLSECLEILSKEILAEGLTKFS